METYGNLAESGDVVGHSQDSGLENCGFAEEKSGAGEGNRTLVSGLGSPHSTIEPHPQES